LNDKDKKTFYDQFGHEEEAKEKKAKTYNSYQRKSEDNDMFRSFNSFFTKTNDEYYYQRQKQERENYKMHYQNHHQHHQHHQHNNFNNKYHSCQSHQSHHFKPKPEFNTPRRNENYISFKKHPTGFVNQIKILYPLILVIVFSIIPFYLIQVNIIIEELTYLKTEAIIFF